MLQARWLCLLMVLSLLSPLPALAAAQYQEVDELEVNDILQSTQVDLDGDGSPEWVEICVVTSDDMGRTDQLRVRNAQDQIIWKGPVYLSGQAFDPKKLWLGSWHFGMSSVSLVQDLNQDGQIDLLAVVPQSDVRPVSWRFFSWMGQGFVFVESGYLLESQPGVFDWTAEVQDRQTWVHQLTNRNGLLIAEIWQAKSDGSIYTGEANMQVTATGLAVIKWLKTMSKSW